MCCANIFSKLTGLSAAGIQTRKTIPFPAFPAAASGDDAPKEARRLQPRGSVRHRTRPAHNFFELKANTATLLPTVEFWRAVCPALHPSTTIRTITFPAPPLHRF